MSANEAIQSIWEFNVRNEHFSEFLNAYAPDGAWSSIFKKCPGFVKTELKRDRDHPHRFLTIDYWESYRHFSAMHMFVGNEYEEIDKQCEQFFLSETHIGVFEVIADINA